VYGDVVKNDYSRQYLHIVKYMKDVENEDPVLMKVKEMHSKVINTLADNEKMNGLLD